MVEDGGLSDRVQSATEFAAGEPLIGVSDYWADAGVVGGREQEYKVCPLSSIGALTVAHSLSQLAIRELVRRGHKHLVLQNMHLVQTQVNYEEGLANQRRRDAKALSNLLDSRQFMNACDNRGP